MYHLLLGGREELHLGALFGFSELADTVREAVDARLGQARDGNLVRLHDEAGATVITAGDHVDTGNEKLVELLAVNFGLLLAEGALEHTISRCCR